MCFKKSQELTIDCQNFKKKSETNCIDVRYLTGNFK
jgi:hypothetical protein